MSHSKTSLYRHYNAQGKLLYVGISRSVPNIAKPAFEAETEDLLRREFPGGIPSEAR